MSTPESDKTLQTHYLVGEDIDPSDYIEHWALIAQHAKSIFDEDDDIAEIRFELTEAVDSASARYPTSCCFRYFDAESQELSVPVLSCRPSLAQAAWLFEQQFWPQLETFLYSFIAGEGISNAVWNIVFLREAAFLATPNVLMEPTIHFIASGAWSGHDRLDAMEKARRLFASLEHTTSRRHIHRPWIDPKEHDRRVTELINYASEQVNRRCNLANAIRRIIEARALPNDLAADLETVLQANGPI